MKRLVGTLPGSPLETTSLHLWASPLCVLCLPAPIPSFCSAAVPNSKISSLSIMLLQSAELLSVLTTYSKRGSFPSFKRSAGLDQEKPSVIFNCTCSGNAKSGLLPVMEHLVGGQGQLRGAQVHAMYPSDGRGGARILPFPDLF